MPDPIRLRDAAEIGVDRIGAKARTLGVLIEHGFPVPPGAVLPASAFDDAIDAVEWSPAFREAVSRLDTAPSSEVSALCEQVRRMVFDLPFDGALAARIAAAVATLPSRTVGVRSSSNLEDGSAQTLAGLHDTVLDVPPDGVAQATRVVWASAWSPRTVAVLRARGISATSVRMGVIFQTFVSATAAGVALTADPFTGSRDHLTISAVRGLGEELVSGRVAPTRFVVRRAPADILHREHGDARRPVAVSDEQVLRIAKCARHIETTLGGVPVDIEWAWSGDTLAVLQARPMIIRAPETASVWRSPIPGASWRSGWRLGEWLPDPVRPLFASWMLPRLVAAREASGTGAFGWVLPPSFSMFEPWYCLLNGYLYRRLDAPPSPPRPPGPPPPPSTYDPAIIRDRLDAYRAHVEAMHAGFDVRRATHLELCDRVDQLIEEAGDLWFLVSSIGGFGFEERRFRPLYERLVEMPDRPHHALFFNGYPSRAADGQQALFEIAQAVRGDPDAYARLMDISAGGARIEDLPPDIRARLDHYIAMFGHQLASADFAESTSGEDPTRVLAIVRAMVERESRSPAALAERARHARKQAVARVIEALADDHGTKATFEAHLAAFQSRAMVREDAIFHFQMGWPHLRRILGEMARRLVEAGALTDPESVYFLDQDELRDTLGAIEQGAVVPMHRVVATRAELWRRQRRLTPPKVIGSERPGGPSTGKGLVDDGHGRRLVGDGASPGRYRGPVRVVRTLEDVGQVERGDVIVVHIALPALAPAMLIAGALVADMGGGSSHSSLLAREFGLPAIVNTIDATSILRPGQVVDVDGTRGVVTIA